MNETVDMDNIDEHIQTMKQSANALIRMGENFPALTRNTVRILASIKMLEINVSDIVDL